MNQAEKLSGIGDIGKLRIKFPVQVKCADGDTLDVEGTYFVDTGMPWDIALMPTAKELDFFNKKEDAIWTVYDSWYHRYYTVNATLFNNYSVDLLRIYTFDKPSRVPHDYLIGQNFLKRFNVFFDMKNMQVGFQPIKNFKNRDITYEDIKKDTLVFDIIREGKLNASDSSHR